MEIIRKRNRFNMDKSLSEMNASSEKIEILRYDNKNFDLKADWIVREEPLEIKIVFQNGGMRKLANIAITMRTPGNDFDLVRGFLFTEGIIQSNNQIENIQYNLKLPKEKQQLNSVIISLKPVAKFDVKNLTRHFYTTSSCGICGKASMELVHQNCHFKQPEKIESVDTKTILSLAQKAFNDQSLFQQTGGIHGAALFDISGHILTVQEDIGRHNAVDKAIGWAMENASLPLHNQILFVSGRCGFELVQKAVMAGVTHFVSVGAASSLSIELARETNLVLIGFLKRSKFNIYSGQEYVNL